MSFFLRVILLFCSVRRERTDRFGCIIYEKRSPQPAFSDSISPPPHPALSPKQMRESLIMHLEACVLCNDWEGSLCPENLSAYLGVASKDCLTHKVGEVEGVADQGTPTEEVGQAQPPARKFFFS